MTRARPLNILEVVGICGGGLGRHVRCLCRDLVARGHRVVAAYVPHGVDTAFQRFTMDYGERIRFVPLEVPREISPAADARGVVQLLRLVRAEGPFDVVHGHSAKGGAIARTAGRLSGVPTVYTPHSLIMSSPGITKAQAVAYTSVERALGHFATSRIVAVSEDERALALKLKLAPRDRIVVIENGLDDEEIERLPGEATFESLHQRPLTFGAAMRFSAQKAPGLLVEAFARLTEALPRLPMRLVIAGDGELFGEVSRRVEASGMGKRIHLLGWSTDVGALLRELDVFVVSSLYEGFSYSIMEAMAAKLPVVSTNVFGTNETVSRVRGNVVVPAGDPDALADGMRRLATLTGPESLRRVLREIGQSNHALVRAHFRQSEATRRTLDLYTKLSLEGKAR